MLLLFCLVFLQAPQSVQTFGRKVSGDASPCSAFQAPFPPLQQLLEQMYSMLHAGRIKNSMESSTAYSPNLATPSPAEDGSGRRPLQDRLRFDQAQWCEDVTMFV